MSDDADRLTGRVVQRSRRAIRVDVAGATYRCSLRGKFREHGPTLPIVVGDRVEIAALDDREGVVEDVLPRTSELTRVTAGGKVVSVAANMEQVLLVLSACEPPPRWSLVDRVFVAAGRHELSAAVVVNKWDRVADDLKAVQNVQEKLALYERLGYETFLVSAVTGIGLDSLRDWLTDRLTVLTGHSGVGKSTLLNALDTDLELVTGSVSEYSGKGRHTTTAVTLYPMPFAGYVADTPGFREFALSGIHPSEIGHFFPEFVPHLAECKYKNCLHREEPSCAVRRAVATGEVSKRRYNSYLRILSARGMK